MPDRVISGGQTGADQAGLWAAHLLFIPTGGFMPKGFRTQDGPAPELAACLGLVEHESSEYPPRTYANVEGSDATIRLALNFYSPGELCTKKALVKYRKPHLDIRMDAPRPVKEVQEWLRARRVSVLNVAGNSEQTAPGIGMWACQYLMEVFRPWGLPF